MVDQNSIFGGMLTTLGAAKKTNCDALGIPWEPRYMLIGDANGTDPVPSPTQTKLISQRYRAQLNQLRVSPTDNNVLIAELVLPPDVGGWWIRELALEDKDGVFSAVANVAPSYKPLLAQGSGRNQVVRMHIITSGTSNIQLKIDPSVVLATRQYVDEKVGGLLPSDKVAGSYTKVTVDDRGVFVSGSNPSTLSEYGITNSYTKTEVDAKTAQATELKLGTAKIATQALTDAGVDDTTIVTPKKLRFGFQIGLGTNGYIAFPSWLGGLVLQWGSTVLINSGSSVSVPMPLEFPNAILNAFISVNGSGNFTAPLCGAVNATSKTAINVYHFSGGGGSANYRWLAVGR